MAHIFGSSGNSFLENSWDISSWPVSYWLRLSLFFGEQPKSLRQLLSFPKRTHWTNPGKKNWVLSTNSSNFVRGLLGFAPIQNVWWNFIQKHHATPKHVELTFGMVASQLVSSFAGNREMFLKPTERQWQPRCAEIVGHTFGWRQGQDASWTTYCWPLQTSLRTSRSKHLSLWFGSISAYWNFLNVQEPSRIMHQNPIDFKTNTSNTHFQVTLS